MAKPSQKSPGRPRSVEAEQAMFQAVLELLGEVGFERMSMEAISRRAGIGKTTIYRRYASKSELVADAIESIRQEVKLPDSGNLRGDLELLVEDANQMSLTPIGRQTVAMIISSAAVNPGFAQIYWTQYLKPRQAAFHEVIERAKMRAEVEITLDPSLMFDVMSGFMLYALLFPPAEESWRSYVLRGLEAWLGGMKTH